MILWKCDDKNMTVTLLAGFLCLGLEVFSVYKNKVLQFVNAHHLGNSHWLFKLSSQECLKELKTFLKAYN